MTASPSTQSLPLAHSYNLARLGNAGDKVAFSANETERTAIARWSGIVLLESFEAQVEIAKLAPNRFDLSFLLTADVTQACVVTLEPVKSRMERRFERKLQFHGPARHKQATSESGLELVLDSEEDGPEEIDSLHYDLAGPVLEEFVLSLEPYPRRPGVEFSPKTVTQDQPESPFAVLKGLK
jgi:hypothetical protein